MANQSKEQKEIIEQVMGAFKRGELESSSGTKVEQRKQAIAIALHEAGASKAESDEQNEENLRRTKQRERRGETAGDAREGEGEGEGSSDAGAPASQETKQELYDEAKKQNIEGRSKMSKEELAQAISKTAGRKGR